MDVNNAFSKTLFCYWKFQRYASWTVLQSVIALWRSITFFKNVIVIWEVFGNVTTLLELITFKALKRYHPPKKGVIALSGT